MIDEQRIEYIKRMQEGMRAMTSEEIAAKQARDNLVMHHSPTTNGDAALNMWPGIVADSADKSA